MTTENQLTVSPSADPAAIAAAESSKQRIQAAYTMAKTYPRNQEQARQNILAACKRPGFAEKAEYSKPVGGGSIKGPSIRLAELALREWGNSLADTAVVYEDEKIRRIKIYITDFETNAQFSKEVTVSKTVERKNKKGREVVGERKNTYGDTVYIVIATDDELLNKEAALISKAIRNEGLRLIPSDIIEEALDVARKTRSSGASDPSETKRKVLDAFQGIGISVVEIEKYLKHPIATISPAEIDDLRLVHETVKSGESQWSEYVKSDEPEAKPADILADVKGDAK